ncbi:uncharacterized protein LOC132751570 isoform X2 [Ruditapes philippinarum]|uniref:uncharacterized protein LOC132751570 isoform X2 n=1 Tax=Ruditapes philippinarum TaxID=129788 RepID=UPI00295B0AD5|nr:uncharacterized protein LOC132751570 isoform X2 [Ruditapes philippinarum]
MLFYTWCMSSEDLNIIKIQLGTSKIGRCYSACSHTPFIGIDGQMCYCMQVKPEKDIRELGCNSGCTDTHNAACGGHKVTSVYRMLSHNDSRHIPEKQEYNKSCLRLVIDKAGSKTYQWRLCSDKVWVFCRSDSDQSIRLFENRKSWRDAATICFQIHGNPIGYEDVRNVTFVAKYGWTGIVWSDVIYNDNEYRENSSDISHGYLKYNSSLGYVLQFSKDVTSKYILCNEMKTTIPHSTMTVPKTTKTPVTAADEKKKSSNESSSNDTDVTLIVGSSVSATLLAVVIVILLFLAKRKELLVRCCKTRSLTNDHGANEHVQTGRRNSNELALPGQISGSLYQSLEAPSGRNDDPHTYSDLQMYCALENIKVGTNNMESEYSQLSLPR